MSGSPRAKTMFRFSVTADSSGSGKNISARMAMQEGPGGTTVTVRSHFSDDTVQFLFASTTYQDIINELGKHQDSESGRRDVNVFRAVVSVVNESLTPDTWALVRRVAEDGGTLSLDSKYVVRVRLADGTKITAGQLPKEHLASALGLEDDPEEAEHR